jgi:2-oxoglutarate ferredoxin oxidoreductase subunit delta
MSMEENNDEVMYQDTPLMTKRWLEERFSRNESKIAIAKGWCKKCGICVSVCPVKALDTNPEGYPFMPKEETCIICGTCEKMCPDFAIIVTRLKDKKKVV